MSALTGIRVLDLTRLLPGPYGTMILVDQGAEVIKVEEPGTGDPLRVMQETIEGMDRLFAIINRGKRSVTLNLRSEAGQSLFHRLLEHADVLIEGFRPGVMQRLGLDYEALAERYPKLVYCSISGFGQSSSQAQLPGHDLNYLGWAGLLATFDAGAAMPPTLMADVQAGLCAAFGIVLALQERANTGKGRYVDIDMTRSLAPFLLPGIGSGTISSTGAASRSRTIPDEMVPDPERRPWFCGGLACYNVYRTADRKLITLAALESKFWHEFCAVVGRPDLADDHLNPQRQVMLQQAVAEIIREKPLIYWLDLSNNRDICIGPVRTQAEALADESFSYEGWPGPLETSGRTAEAPELGADNRRILVEELGCDPALVDRASAR